ncbi:MAG: hypothetical protein ACKVWR_20005 [Acidimicrobiales bacterium]
MTHEQHAVVWPRSAKTVELAPLAARPDTLENKRVAFLWDYLFRGDEIFPLIEQALAERFPGISFVGYKEFGTTHGAGEHEVLAGLAQKLKELEVDAVVSGMGC